MVNCMMTGYEKLRVPDQNLIHPFFIEVNWSKSKKVNECKVLRITFPNGDTAFVKKEHLHAILFALGNAEEQRRMIPQTIQNVRWYETVVSVKAKKDIYKGENITFPLKITLPETRRKK